MNKIRIWLGVLLLSEIRESWRYTNKDNKNNEIARSQTCCFWLNASLMRRCEDWNPEKWKLMRNAVAMPLFRSASKMMNFFIMIVIKRDFSSRVYCILRWRWMLLPSYKNQFVCLMPILHFYIIISSIQSFSCYTKMRRCKQVGAQIVKNKSFFITENARTNFSNSWWKRNGWNM